MNNFFRFLVRHNTTLVFLLLEAVAVALVLTCNDYHRASYLTTANVVSGSLSRLTGSVGRYLGLAEENEALARRNMALRQEVSALRAMLEAVPDSVLAEVPLEAQAATLRFRKAHVIGGSTNRSRNMLTLDAGEDAGIGQDMAVLNPQGVVGLVVATSAHFSLVLPLINTGSHLSVKVKSGNFRGQMVWDGFSSRRAQVYDIPEHATVEPGDTIVTSGVSAFFPEGLVVGTVCGVEPDRNGGFFNLDVELAVDFNSVYDVVVVENLVAGERAGLENSVADE